ncbi:hypothetical protein KAU11_03710 [Candidatus Babeliales bacterium]|nr:hypothetical protein [Candidatus Babeliales bacterium]
MTTRQTLLIAAALCLNYSTCARVTDTAKASKNFLLSTFNQTNQTMFLASNASVNQTDGSYSLAQSTLLSDGTITVQPIAPQSVILNDVATTLSPIYGAQITNLALMNGKPVVSVDSVGNRIFLINSTTPSNTILQPDPLTVTDESTAADQIVRLTASSDKIFAALKPTGSAFGTATSCIRALKANRSETKLESYARTRSMHNATAPTGIRDLMGNATLSAIPEMCWDEDLQRLFIGLTLSLANEAKVGILVGRFEETQLALTGAIDISLLIGGEVKIAGENVYDPMSTNHLKIMTTSTNKKYIIAQIDADTVTTDVNESAKIFALPLVMNNATAANIGKISENSGSGLFTVPAAALANLHDGNSSAKDEAPALVGGARPPVTDSVDITNIQIVGDSIFIASDSVSTGENGVFSSTAIFNTDGAIRGWTPWARTGGIYAPAYSLAIDETSGNMWTTYTSTLAGDTIGQSQWGTGNTTGSTLYGLADLTETFAQNMHWSNGGIWHSNIFESETTGLGTNSWLVAAGYRKIYLVKMGIGIAPKTIPATTFTGDNNIHSFSEELFVLIRELYCSETSRTSASNSGWLFIGSSNGLLVLSKANGTGWDSSSGLANCDTGGGGNLEGCTFKLLTGISEPVYSLRADGTNLFVMTDTHLYKVTMGATHFGGTDTDISTVTTLEFSCASDEKLVDLKATGGYYDSTLKAAHAILATTKRLYYKTDIHGAGTWTEISLPNSDSILSIDLKTVDPQAIIKNNVAPVGSAETIANLYVLMGALPSDTAKLYRFEVKGVIHADATPANRYFESITAVNQIDTTDPMVNLSPLRMGFYINGVGYSYISSHAERTDLLKNFKITNDADTMKNSHAQTDVSWNAHSPYYFANLLSNNANGTLIAAGSFGIRVNE